MRFTIARKLTICFGVLLILFFLSGSFNIISFNESEKKVILTKDESVIYAQYANDMKLSVVQVQQWLTDISATRAKQGFDDGFLEAENYANEFFKLCKEFKKLFEKKNLAEWLVKLEGIEYSFTDYYKVGREMANEYITKGEDAGNLYMEKFDPYAEAINEKIHELWEFQMTEMHNAMDSIVNNVSFARSLSLFIMISACLIGVVLVLFISRAMVKNIYKIVSISDRVSKGEIIQQKINVKSSDEITLIAKAFNKLIDYLRGKGRELEKISEGDFSVNIEYASQNDQFAVLFEKMVSTLNYNLNQVKKAALQITGGSDKISESTISLSQGANEQASSLQEISSSINQIAGQVKQNAVNTTQANDLVKMAMENAVKGNKQMEALVESMARINASTDEIKKIVKVIDDIAFQINLLALNANVEAARAGKYGKGFAVVAEEVRNLANRSSRSVQDTTEMVDDAIKNVKDGNSLLVNTASQLTEIVTGTEKVLNLIREISIASNDQSNGISQVSVGLNQIEKVTQNNTVNAEESALSVKELNNQAIILKDMISQFNLFDLDLDSYADIQNRELESGQERKFQQSGNKNFETLIKPSDTVLLKDN